jgi:ubiquinone/menaquinone biosynthesis C-methylase UbiE
MDNVDNKWNKLYDNYIKEDFKDWNQYFRIKMKLKKRFLNLVIKYSKSGKPVLECGAGTGKFSAYLASLGINSYAMDIETAMIEQAKELSDKVSPNNPVKVLQGDIRNIPFDNKFFSVTHSSGVLEHYNDSEIVAIINEQLRVSDVCVFSVPTSYFEKKMLGNERFMLRKEWRKIISQSNAKIIKETGYHYKTLDKRVIDIIKKPKRIFKPIALYTFVLTEKGE